MYSSSNSFIGNANGGRPAQTHFPQAPAIAQSYSSFPQGQHPQQNNFMSQPTGFGGDQILTQLTGYPSAAPQQPTFQNALQPPQFAGYPLSQPPQPQQSSASPAIAGRPTGQTSSQVAKSFQEASPASNKPSQPTGSRIPNMRLSFITAQDQARFEQLFKSAVGDAQALDGL